eukprot:gene11562-4810_t
MDARTVKKYFNTKEIKIGISVIHKYIHEHLQYTRKKKANQIAYYRCLDRVQNLRKDFKKTISQFHPYSFIYIDESHFDFHVKSKNYAYGQKGRIYSLLAAHSAWGIIHYEIIDTTKNVVNSSRFEFLKQLIIKIPEEAILLLDNDFFNPDYNPIELLFSFLKLKIKNYENFSLLESIEKAIEEVTEIHLQSWIHHSAYDYKYQLWECSLNKFDPPGCQALYDPENYYLLDLMKDGEK